MIENRLTEEAVTGVFANKQAALDELIKELNDGPAEGRRAVVAFTQQACILGQSLMQKRCSVTSR